MIGPESSAPEETAPGAQSSGETPQARPVWRKAAEWAVILGAAFCAALLLRAFVLEALRVPSSSMEPSLLPGDFVVVSKLSGRRPQVGDVTAFRVPAGVGRPDAVYVKRCVAGPGDTVIQAGGRLLVNRIPVDPPGASAPAEGRAETLAAERVWAIPRPGESIALHDSVLYLWHSLIEREGHTVAGVPGGGVLLDGSPATAYRVEQNQYFVVGDNRSGSFDSRHWGLLPERSLLGKVILVYWSWDDARSAVRWGRIGTIVR